MTPRKKPNRPRFDELFEGLKQTLENEGRVLSNLTNHQGEKGRLNETHLKTVLRQYLPAKFGIGTGFIVSKNSFNESTGPQIDIVIYDAINNSPIYTSEAFSIFPVEMVYGYIEVKTTVSRSDIRNLFQRNRDLRALKDDKTYANVHSTAQLPPRFYVFAYNTTYKEQASLQRAIREEFEHEGEAHAHGIYVLKFDMLVSRVARNDPGIVELNVWPDRAFPNFITSIVKHCELMIPRLRVEVSSTQHIDLPVSLTLPLADMSSYFSKPVKG